MVRAPPAHTHLDVILRPRAPTVHDADHTTGEILSTASTPGQSALNHLVITIGRHQTVVSGTAVFREGSLGSSVYAVVSGRFKLEVTTPGGREVVLGVVGPGQVFGELSALDGLPRSASVIALERSVVSMVTREELLDSLASSPGLALELLRSLSERMRGATINLSERADTPTAVRAARRLHALATLGTKERASPAGKFDLAITQNDLAAWIGATREATARALATLRRDGVVRTGRGTITVLDVARLAELAQGRAVATPQRGSNQRTDGSPSL
jgi:CRP/FNR family transcriptional regulator, cyclic AMP receptor protein